MAKTIIMTPFGKAIFPKLKTPDTYKGQTKYKTNLELSKEDQAKFEAQLAEIAKGERFEVKKPKMPYKDDEKYGRSLAMSSKFKPAIFDTRNNRLPEDVDIGGGSIIRCQVEVFNYKDGLSLRVLKVQVKDLKTRDANSSPFEEVEDGFEVDEADQGFPDDGESEGGATSALDI